MLLLYAIVSRRACEITKEVLIEDVEQGLMINNANNAVRMNPVDLLLISRFILERNESSDHLVSIKLGIVVRLVTVRRHYAS